MLDLLDSLVKKSLVLADEKNGVMRYGLLETIRQYGRARLAEAGEEAAIRARHQHWYAELAEWAAPRVLGPDLVRTCNQLSLELDNLRTALAWAREAPAEQRRSALDHGHAGA